MAVPSYYEIRDLPLRLQREWACRRSQSVELYARLATCTATFFISLQVNGSFISAASILTVTERYLAGSLARAIVIGNQCIVCLRVGLLEPLDVRGRQLRRRERDGQLSISPLNWNGT